MQVTMGSQHNLNMANLWVIASVFTAFFTFFYIMLLDIIPTVVTPAYPLEELQAFFCIFIGSAIVAASFTVNKQTNVKTIFICLILTAIATILLLVASSIFQVVLIFASGIFFGVGQVNILSHFWRNNSAEKRGLVGGIICAIFLLFYFTLNFAAAQENWLSYKILVSLIPIIFAAIVTLLYSRNGRQTLKVHTKKKC